MRRAAHSLLDAEPKILADVFARGLAGFSTDAEFLRAFQAVPNAHIPWLRVSFALRNRLAEDELAKAVTQGTKQYVILGAGLDSFAYRQPDLVRSLDVYEVDHPASQAWKRERVAALGIEVPPTLHYAPVDFERNTLTEGLTTAGLNRSEPAFFTWLDVTQYLTREAVLRTLREVAALSKAEGTLVLEFIAPPGTLSDEDAALVHSLAEASAELGEPWLSFFTSEDMHEALTRVGFRFVQHFGPAEAFDRYLRGRTDGARLPGYFRMAKATMRERSGEPPSSTERPLDGLKRGAIQSKIGPCG
jgi:methyltransferase (TIGR00027 family)